MHIHLHLHGAQNNLAEAEDSPQASSSEESSSDDDEDEGAPEQIVWVGGIPEAVATEDALREAFGACGAISAVTVRVKETAEHGANKSWAFVKFADDEVTIHPCSLD
jgi:RNA recognition motif-containing protein